MGARVTVAILGDDLAALANSLWAAGRMERFLPDRVHLLAMEGPSGERAASVARCVLDALAAERSFEIATVPLPSPRFMDWGRKAAEIVKQEKESGAEVALDVSAAPMDGAIASSIASWNRKVDRIFHLDQARYAHLDNPLLLLPLPELRLNDYVAQSREGAGGGRG
jgi:hypothetical protein